LAQELLQFWEMFTILFFYAFSLAAHTEYTYERLKPAMQPIRMAMQ